MNPTFLPTSSNQYLFSSKIYATVQQNPLIMSIGGWVSLNQNMAEHEERESSFCVGAFITKCIFRKFNVVWLPWSTLLATDPEHDKCDWKARLQTTTLIGTWGWFLQHTCIGHQAADPFSLLWNTEKDNWYLEQNVVVLATTKSSNHAQ